MEIEQKKIQTFMENLISTGVQITGKKISITFDQTTCKAMGSIQVIESCVEKTPVHKSVNP